MAGTDRTRSADEPRSATEREWEVFLRDVATEPARHVGSVTAPTVDVAHEQAAMLFDSHARDIWLCPADELTRYSSGSLADRGSSAQ